MTLTIYATFATAEEAQTIARALLEERLVACANIMAAHESLYWWEGEIQSGRETGVLFKTRADLFDQVTDFIKARHSYAVPCIVAWPVEQGHGPFLQWIMQETEK
ncbi:MAG: divalent-cation tolerance protein CutA [Alphaproteobacteria bacterium]|nr:divalent-cation tolerance protein CutA [Alphaproteobacteria bacterium]